MSSTRVAECVHDSDGKRYIVSKRVPIRGIKTMFMYGFSLPVADIEELNEKISQCESMIDRDIMVGHT